MTASQNPDCKLSITWGSHRHEATARHDRPDSGSASAGASRMESGELRRPATRSVRRIRVPSLKNTLTFLREHPTGGEGQAARVRRNIIGS